MVEFVVGLPITEMTWHTLFPVWCVCVCAVETDRRRMMGRHCVKESEDEFEDDHLKWFRTQHKYKSHT